VPAPCSAAGVAVCVWGGGSVLVPGAHMGS
jgi:hypothetical protein